ncbi:E3 ubiquitin-protein ligase rififylin [Bombina bombina]|uniref:E3 ubiquitin-protein ligase rififylin n=1 Tax=Bombina bombina TaxID=8345 RepID=UPI00235A8890|nr:E3 ubiquitin-protein ligase rififylin [Bombina bombina]XP_053563408.1 E3 ubiquitin-protein ligase rififylin [Bombina bombina]
MWAACCNWLCLDTQPEDGPTGRTQACANPNFRTSPPTPEIVTCRACNIAIPFPFRKNPCMDCRKIFCASCLSQMNSGPSLCQLCGRIRSTSFIRDELMKLKVKDLRDYLSMRDIPTDMCREKEDLVQLVLTQKPPTVHTDVTNNSPLTSDQNRSNQRENIAPTPTYPSQDFTTINRNTSTSQQERSHRQTEAQSEEETQSTDSDEVLVPGRRASLSDINNLDDIEALSVRQLKEILARNFVNYKGCCEKWELMERVTRLYNEQKGLQQIAFIAEEQGKSGVSSDDSLCKVCMDSPIDCVLLECGHMVTCTKCGKRMNECPICRQYVVRAVHVFRS